MYQVLDNGIITLTRGDTFNYTFSIKDDVTGEQLILTEDDDIYFGLCEPNQLWEDAIVKKICEKLMNDNNKYTGEYKLSLNSIDTQFLYPGKYYYSIKLKQIVDDEEIVTTLREKTLFWIE